MRTVKHIPGTERKRWWRTKWARELFFSGPPVLGASIVMYKAFETEPVDPTILWITLAGSLWLVFTWILRVIDAAQAEAKEKPEFLHEGLYAAVSTVQLMLSEYCSSRKCGGDIRATFHRVVPPLDRALTIEQIIPYCGAEGGGIGREFSLNTGITGQAIRSRNPVTMSSSSTSEASHRQELVSDWGYTEAQARALTAGRYSAMAVPVLDATGQHVLGVIYFDSGEHEIFDRADVQEVLVAGFRAISDFVTKRY